MIQISVSRLTRRRSVNTKSKNMMPCKGMLNISLQLHTAEQQQQLFCYGLKCINAD